MVIAHRELNRYKVEDGLSPSGYARPEVERPVQTAGLDAPRR
jgi:hypothetical protein